MPNLTVTLSKAFLDHFHYCDQTGRRSNTSFFMRLFYNRAQTAELEMLAVDTVNAMQHIHDESLHNKCEQVEAIYKLLQETREKAWNIRIKYGSTQYSAGGGKGTSEPAYWSETTRPKKQSKFEKSLGIAMKAMIASVDGILRQPADGNFANSAAFRAAYADLLNHQSQLHDNAKKLLRKGAAE